MKTTMLLLVSALSLLVIPAIASPTHSKPDANLNIIIHLAEKYNESLTKEFFVDDVRPLVEAGCEDKFFCKVYEILHERPEHAGKLVNNLRVFIEQKNINCTESLKDVTPTGVSIQLPELMRHLITCSQRRNFTKGKKND
uniref:Interleukin 4/13A n=1 Tax=Anabas testudineus TaxID=64144 RepID=A0AAQ6IEC8_ANATE